MHGVLLDTPVPSDGPAGLPWPAVVLGILTLIYITVVRPMRKKQQQKDPLSRPPGARSSAGSSSLLAQQRAVERDMTALLVEYEQMMRTMTGQLETRVAKLEVLLAEADTTIASLRAEKAAAAGGPRTAERSADRTKATGDGKAGEGRLAPSTAVTPTSHGTASLVPASADDSGAGFDVPPEDPAPADEPPAARPAEPEPAAHADVYSLADEGLSYRQIAQRLDRQYGEIELILNIRPKGVATAPATPADHPAPAAPPPDRWAAGRDPEPAATAAGSASSAPTPRRDDAAHRHGNKPRKKHR